MTREIVLGNGKMAIAIDRYMKIRDFFYPNVGLENHVGGHEFRIGVWTNDGFSWIGEDWEIKMMYMPETLVGKSTAKNQNLSIEISLDEAVHSFHNIYLRMATVYNLNDSKKEIRLFFSHDFHIYGEDSGDTVMYEPKTGGIVHYKRKRYFLINGTTSQNHGIFQYATGLKEAFGKEGTWKDAEDGILQGNPVAQGSVDSTVSFKVEIDPNSSATIYYWIACGKNLDEVIGLDSMVKKIGVEQLLLETENYWSAWVNRQGTDMSILPRDIIRFFKTSLLIMRTHVDNNGGIIASCDSDVLQFNRDTYSYIWPRDASIAAIAFDMAGFPDVSRLIFQFCSQVIGDKGYFSHKYSPDGSIGSSWHALVDAKGNLQLPIQEDETALVLYALWKHYQKYHDLEFIGQIYPNLVLKTTEFLLNYRDEGTWLPKPSYDLWEETIGVFTSTVATVCAALQSAAKFAKVFYDRDRQILLNSASVNMKKAMLSHLYNPLSKRFKKAINDQNVDSAFSFAFMYGALDAEDDTVVNSMNALVDRLWVKTEIGGVARYEGDKYYRVTEDLPGNPWFICTLWLARWHIARAKSIDQLNDGLKLLKWVVKHSLASGMLPEQLNPHIGTPISVSPLIWSHAEFVIAVCEYLEKYKELSLVST